MGRSGEGLGRKPWLDQALQAVLDFQAIPQSRGGLRTMGVDGNKRNQANLGVAQRPGNSNAQTLPVTEGFENPLHETKRSNHQPGAWR